LCHGTVCVVGKMRDLILQLSKSSIYSTKPFFAGDPAQTVNSSSISFMTKPPAPIATLSHMLAPSTEVLTINMTLLPISGALSLACPIITPAEIEKL
ncbi:TPA: hypothetical protein MI376_17960, partial [Klebsiella pneumoniae]|nr:hypothetical protein [Klebsiella pneumoniae]